MAATSSCQSGEWLVILNQSLAESELHRLLQTHRHKIKVSTGTLPHTCLFPQSSVAFMIVPMTEILSSTPIRSHHENHPPQINFKLMDNLLNFSKLRHKCYVLLCAPLISTNEQQIFSLVQEKFLTEDLQFIAAHNSKECVEYMTSIAKVTCNPLSTMIRQRYESVKEQLLTEEYAVGILQEMVDISERECVFLLDGCRGLAGIGEASLGGLKDCNLDARRAKELYETLHSDKR